MQIKNGSKIVVPDFGSMLEGDGLLMLSVVGEALKIRGELLVPTEIVVNCQCLH